MDRHILGIDVGTSAIKVFIGTIRNNDDIVIAGSGTMPTSGFTKGKITDVQALAMSISQAIECAVMATNISVRHAYIGFGGVEISSINSTGSIAPASVAAVTQEDINHVYQAAVLAGVPDDHEVLHILPKYFFVDKNKQVNLPLQQKCAHLEVETHIVTVPKVVICDLMDALEKLGVHVLGIVANSIVTTQALRAIGAQQYLFMDIGAGTTDLVLSRNREIVLSASLPLGGNYITSDIMKGLNVSNHHAEDIKKYYSKLGSNLRGQNIILDCNDYGTTDKQFSYDFLYDIIESRIDEIVYLIHNYLESTMAGNGVEKILLTGGCGAMPSFVECLEKKFATPVEVVNPKELLLEYGNSGNVACYGVLRYAMHHMPGTQASSNNAWRSLLSKFSKFFNI